MVRRLLDGGAAFTIEVAAGMGDLARIRELLDEDPECISKLGDFGGRPLGEAAQRAHAEAVKLLLDRGVDPNLRFGRDAPNGTALWHAARMGNVRLATLLLDAGADPNSSVESSGTATWNAKDPELRALFYRRGGTVDVGGLLLDGNIDAVLAVADAAPEIVSSSGCGGIFTFVVSFEKRELLQPLLDRGVRVPDVVTGCRTYLWHVPDMTRVLLEHGMNPNLPNWQRVTPLHELCHVTPFHGMRSAAGRRRMAKQAERRLTLIDLFLEFGANVDAIDEEFRSTPLGWAARSGLEDAAEALLKRGADPNKSGEPWATPLAWARKRGHRDIAAVLRDHGAR